MITLRKALLRKLHRDIKDNSPVRTGKPQLVILIVLQPFKKAVPFISGSFDIWWIALEQTYLLARIRSPFR